MEKTVGFFDLETTGTDVSKDRIVQISIIKTNLSFQEIERKKLLLNPTIPIPKEATDVHGITDLDVSKCFKFSDYSQKLLTYFDSFDYIAGYNIKGYDVPLIYEEFSRCGLVWNPKPIFDPCVIFKNREKRNLEAAYLFYCGKQIDGAHDAEIDNLATIEVLKGQVEKYEFDDLYTQEIINGETIHNKYPLEKTLELESKYDNEDKRLSWDGKIIISEEGVAIFNFGKLKGEPISSADLGYINWFLTSDFPSQTKNVFRSLINKK